VRQKVGAPAEQAGKEVVRRHSEQTVCPRSETGEAAEASLRGRQVEEASEGIWDAEQADRHSTSR
jgi:hypothetical protein